VTALVVVVAVIILPFGVPLLFDHPKSVMIEPLTRWAISLALLVAPVVGLVVGLRRGLVLRVALVIVTGLMSLTCVALLMGVTSTQGIVQTGIASAIAGVALSVAFRIKPGLLPNTPARLDLPQSSS
jgi:hypothetical protein